MKTFGYLIIKDNGNTCILSFIIFITVVAMLRSSQQALQ